MSLWTRLRGHLLAHGRLGWRRRRWFHDWLIAAGPFEWRNRLRRGRGDPVSTRREEQHREYNCGLQPFHAITG